MLGIPQEDEDEEINDWKSSQVLKSLIDQSPELRDELRERFKHLRRPASEKVEKLVENKTDISPPPFEVVEPDVENPEKFPAPAPVPMDVAKKVIDTVTPRNRYVVRNRF